MLMSLCPSRAISTATAQTAQCGGGTRAAAGSILDQPWRRRRALGRARADFPRDGWKWPTLAKNFMPSASVLFSPNSRQRCDSTSRWATASGLGLNSLPFKVLLRNSAMNSAYLKAVPGPTASCSTAVSLLWSARPLSSSRAASLKAASRNACMRGGGRTAQGMARLLATVLLTPGCLKAGLAVLIGCSGGATNAGSSKGLPAGRSDEVMGGFRAA